MQPQASNSPSDVPQGQGHERKAQATAFRPLLTWSLIMLTIAMFVLTTFFGMHSAKLFGVMRLVPMTLNLGNSWTLVTSMFLHADIGHLLANMYSLFVLGTACEQMFGRRRYTIAYFGGGIVGGLMFAFLRQGEVTSAVGASGAIFSLLGLYGAFLMELRKGVRNNGQSGNPSIDAAWKNFVMILLINTIIIPMQGNIAWEGHLGGFVFGFLYGRWFIPRAIQEAASTEVSMEVKDENDMAHFGEPIDGNIISEGDLPNDGGNHYA